MRILVVDDEPKISAYLKKGLSENGFVVDVASDGQAGEFAVATNDYDLLIVDVLMPKMDGWSMVRQVRASKHMMPVLFLTARDAVEDRVKGLELGADDYLVKPFAFSELLARVRTLLRRGTMTSPEQLVVGDLVLDLIRHKARRGTVRLDLTPQEFSLLTLLMRRMGEVISRTMIASQVWDMNFDSDSNVVDVAVRRLRRKVDDPFSVKLIHTIRGVGYVLEDPVEVV